MVKRSDSIGIPLPAQIHSAHKLRHKKEEYETMIPAKNPTTAPIMRRRC